MNLIKKLGLSLALVGLMASTAQAIPITGDISFGGAVVLRVGSGGPVGTVATATWIDFSSTSVFVTAVGGSYVGAVAPGALATFTDYLFSPGTPAIPTLWTVPVGASLTAATQTTIIRDTSGLGVLTLKGTGTLNLPGFDPTPGLWTITVSQGTGTFGFGSSAASIPDGGSTVILLGSAILGLLGISRKLRFLA